MKKILLTLIGIALGLLLVFKSTECNTPYCKKRNKCALLLKIGKIDEYRKCSKEANQLK